MKTISLKIDEAIFNETESILSRINKPRNRYINEALKEYNKVQQRKILEARLKKESELVSKKSNAIFPEFKETDYAG